MVFVLMGVRWTEQELALKGLTKDGSKMTPEEESKADIKESKLQKKCQDHLDDKGYYWIHLVDYRGAKGNEEGIADLVCCINGLFVTVENKVMGRKAKPSQMLHRRKVVKAGGISFLNRSYRQFREIIKHIEDNGQARWTETKIENGW